MSFFVATFLGFVLGLGIAAPIGPVSILCMRTALLQGFLPAFAVGMGSTMADIIYSLCMMSGLGSIPAFLVKWRPFLLVSGLAFILLGIKEWHSAAKKQHLGKTTPAPRATSSLLSAVGQSFFMTAVNPATMATFLGLSVFFFSHITTGAQQAGAMLGIFGGTTTWWMAMSYAIIATQKRQLPWLTWISFFCKISAIFLWLGGGYTLTKGLGLLS